MTFYLPTSSKVKIMIQGIDLDLAFRLDWRESTPRVPIYGYNDYYYSKTIRGKTLIQGFLVMNYVAPHYLSAVLENWSNRNQKRSKAEFDAIIATLPSTTTEENRRARAEMLTSLLFTKKTDLRGLVEQGTPGAIKVDRMIGKLAETPGKIGSLLDKIVGRGNAGLTAAAQRRGLVESPQGGVEDFKKKLIDRFASGGNDVVVPNIAGPGDYTLPFNMEIYHMEPEFSNWYVILNDVEITDVSQTVSAAGAEGSSDPLYETYEFVAKRRTIKEVNKAKRLGPTP
jgi:hypothetical protein